MEASIETPVFKERVFNRYNERFVSKHFSLTRDQVGTNEVNKQFANDLPMRADTQNLSSKEN